MRRLTESFAGEAASYEAGMQTSSGGRPLFRDSGVGGFLLRFLFLLCCPGFVLLSSALFTCGKMHAFAAGWRPAPTPHPWTTTPRIVLSG
jgi:hypothetical protein